VCSVASGLSGAAESGRLDVPLAVAALGALLFERRDLTT
jgi:hypothetical protein